MLEIAEREARAEFRNSDKYPEDYRMLAWRLTVIVNAGGNANLAEEIESLKKIAVDMMNIQPMESV